MNEMIIMQLVVTAALATVAFFLGRHVENTANRKCVFGMMDKLAREYGAENEKPDPNQDLLNALTGAYDLIHDCYHITFGGCPHAEHLRDVEDDDPPCEGEDDAPG